MSNPKVDGSWTYGYWAWVKDHASPEEAAAEAARAVSHAGRWPGAGTDRSDGAPRTKGHTMTASDALMCHIDDGFGNLWTAAGSYYTDNDDPLLHDRMMRCNYWGRLYFYGISNAFD